MSKQLVGSTNSHKDVDADC